MLKLNTQGHQYLKEKCISNEGRIDELELATKTMVAQTIATFLPKEKRVLHEQAPLFPFANGSLFVANHIILQLDVHTDAGPTIQFRDALICSPGGM